MPSEDVHGAWTAPLSDPARVRAAARLLADLPQTRGLDRLTALAASLAGVPHAHVAILTDTLVVASRHGRPVGETSDGRLQGTLCAVTARGTEPVVIEDTVADPRSGDARMVVEDRVRAYLGVPIVADDGTVVGALCHVDERPRTWTDAQVQGATDLAAAISTALQLAGVSAELTRLSERQELIMAAGEVGTFDWDLHGGRIHWDNRLKAMFGYDEALQPVRDDFVSRIHPEDAERVVQAVDHAQQTMGDYAVEYRIVQPDDSVRWVRARGRGLAGADGRPARFVGAVHDISEVRAVESRLARILETTPTAFVSLNRDFVITYANPAAERSLGMSAARLQGRQLWDLFPGARGTGFEREYRRVIETGDDTSFEEYEPDLDAWFEVRAWRTSGGLSVYFNDVTERRHAEEDRRVAMRAREDAIRTTQQLAERLRMLAEASGLMGATLVEDEVVQVVLDTLVPGVGPWAAVEMYPDGARPTRRTERSLGPTADRRSNVLTFRMRTRGGRAVGRLHVQLQEHHNVDDALEARMLSSLADRAGVAVDNTRLYAAQQSMSEALQRSMLTTLPTSPALSLAARYRPAAYQAHVGGDWYDAFVRDDGALMLVIGDVMGHDRHAAATMGQMRNLLRGLSIDRGSPSALLAGLDQALGSMAVEGLASATVVRLEALDPGHVNAPRRLCWSNAGHPPPLLLRADGEVRLLEAESELLLGVDPDTARGEHAETLQPYDTLLLYTDGLIENDGNSLAEGLDVLVDVAAKLVVDRDTGVDDLSDRLLETLVDEQPADDIALVAVRVSPQGATRPA
jgi:PAS domain S-box-containing protein